MEIIDTHCHLSFDPLAGDLDGVAAEHAEPRHTRDVLFALADLRGVPPERLAGQTTANAQRLFRFGD